MAYKTFPFDVQSKTKYSIYDHIRKRNNRPNHKPKIMELQNCNQWTDLTDYSTN